MALFGGEKMSKEEKAAAKAQEMLEKYGVGDLKNPEDRERAKKIIAELAGTGMMEVGIALGGGTERDLARLNAIYAKVQMEQNWIIIRQLDAILNK